MLVLTRGLRERVFIGDDVTITVTRIGGNQVWLGIEAPRDVLIRRAELVEQWQGDSMHASHSVEE